MIYHSRLRSDQLHNPPPDLCFILKRRLSQIQSRESEEENQTMKEQIDSNHETILKLEREGWEAPALGPTTPSSKGSSALAVLRVSIPIPVLKDLTRKKEDGEEH
jgi:hypothetical protein